MRAEDLRIDMLLEVDAREGVRFAGERAVILDAVALGMLRKQLVEMLGLGGARAVLTRFGFAHGWRMAEAMRAGFQWSSEAEWMAAGGLIHTLQGLIRIRSEDNNPLTRQGATVEDSYEAEQHLLHLGRAEAPSCWTQCGFASGYLSRVAGRPLYILEDRCVARGDAACHFAGRTLEEWGSQLEEHLPYFQGEVLDASLHQVANALKRTERKLRERTRALERAVGEPEGPGGLVARGPGMRRVVDLARRAARSEATVLLIGESGTGKERVARLVHEESARAAGPLVAINCAALAESLLEAELFGHARGAFTGATHARAGLLEGAAGGTLFLDEIGEMPLGMQAKLLRALQEREIRRVGENHHRRIDVRVVAATNRPLAEEVAAGRFRKDLYYRLRVVELTVPPLRERREDILPLAQVFLVDAARRMGREVPVLGADVADQLQRHAWPGNVRELRNAMERAVALSRGPRIELEDLPEDVRTALPAPALTGAVRTLEELEREYILAVLARNGGSRTRTSRELGIGATTLYRKLKRYERGTRRRKR
ncbi:sigma-54-dependent Fis family transcriptional regulator [Cystobacter ferrugineus]|uniref:Sigma-54-dependent Fis family transcriptional regulator n=1 Tax=Cystobacter ferrugineus TaxID=83449 RepID=A0A1L9AWZ5_9BACT|nr:sigma-54-dependent Fis family transcriptional regulator [Cystobacter ferrugineus]OJH34532.1 sigma-54-dependent Fis family transcriptional regulator [Cystobacter ferrugineus]